MSTPIVAVLSFSRLAHDRRVMRQCSLLAEMGYPAHVIAYASPGDVVDVPLASFWSWPTPRPTKSHRIATITRQLPAHLGLASARAGFWAAIRHRFAFEAIARLRADVVVANDWPALVVAAAWKARSGARLHYDTHEFATLEFDERRWWRLVYKPMVIKLERDAIAAADGISTVGERLAEALQELYDLPTRPAVVRNIPERIALPAPMPPAWPARVLYHGQVLPDRGIETLIDSVPLWREAHSVTIRGNGDPAYLAALRARADAMGCGERITFEPAVTPTQVMPKAAATADLGVHFTPLGTEQRHFSMPNKVFEYIGAGLAVAVSPGADLKQLVERHRVGVVSADPSPHAAAAAIDTLTPERLAAFKTSAREAAAALCWERESEILRATLAPLLDRCPAYQ